MSSKPPQPITVPYQSLKNHPESLHTDLVQAFGSNPGCLGIIVVSDLPAEYIDLRKRLFLLAHAFANLPEEERERYARPESLWCFGWSHGKEIMNGRPDTQKGSYYANPLLDRPDVSEQLRAEHPEYYAGNVWPEDTPAVAEFEPTFKALGKMVHQVGLALARACESFVAENMSNGGSSIERLIAESQSNKARLLHYYPESPSSSSSDRLANDALCGTHIDHSLLTGLCSAMYLSQPDSTSPPIPVPPPSQSTGLWIYPRHTPGTPQPEAVKVTIPPDCLAFQTGEALELLTRGKLAATPHFVSGNTTSDSGIPKTGNVSRETFAFFLQPDVHDVIGSDGETFGAFTKRVLGRHYGDKAMREAED